MKKKRINKYDLIFLTITLVIIVTYVFIRLFSLKSEPILLSYASLKSTNMLTTTLNNSINNVLRKNNNEIIQIEKNNNGDIVNLNFNNKKINEILNLLTKDLLKQIDEYNSKDIIRNNNTKIYYVPIGIMYNSNALSSIGPNIPFKMDFDGSIENEAKIITKEYGINSSIVQVIVIVQLKMQLIFPFNSNTIEIKKEVILDSKIIQGSIPQYYGGIYSSSLK